MFAARTMAEMKELDRKAIEEYGIPSLWLMENAAGYAAELAEEYLEENKKAVIICGTGNNGGDGYAAARILHNKGKDVSVYMVGNPERLTVDACANVKALEELQILVKSYQDRKAEMHEELQEAGVIVDAVFGVGVTRVLEGIYKEAVEEMNGAQCPVISCDLPSGLHGDTGEILGVCVKATETVTFSFPKKGMFLNAGPEMTGKLHVADIGLPEELTQ